MISQGATALGGLIWGSAATVAGPSFTLIGGAVLFLTSLLLVRRFSINAIRNLEETVSGFLSGNTEPDEIAPVVFTNELLPA
jgi:hypothetical protein